jgi:hypothetical protein
MAAKIIDWVGLILLVVGGINWGLVGVFNFDLVATIFGAMSMASKVVYSLVGLAALWEIVYLVRK